MFTGLIEQCSEVTEHSVSALGHRLAVRVQGASVVAGESIAVNGVCLTVLPGSEQIACFDVSPETLAVTNLSTLRVGERVNIERAMQASARMGGHYVTGHVDTTATVLSRRELGDFVELIVGDFYREAKKYLLPKGSVTLDGVSLTINAIEHDAIRIMLVPHTLQQTTLGSVQPGWRINVEFDYIARIIAHQLGSLSNSTILSSQSIWSVSDAEVES